MSGVEILGVLLGVLPLCISAMEYHKKMQKTTRIFRRIQRSYEKDLRNLEDCKLRITLIVKRVLLPLRKANAITESEYRTLLISPGGPIWRDQGIISALQVALGEIYASCMSNFSSMEAVSTDLCKACGVHDSQFQKALETERGQSNVNPGDLPPDERHLILRANDRFKSVVLRAKYALSQSHREELVESLEHRLTVLQSILDASKVLSDIESESSPHSTSIQVIKAPKLWEHTTNVYRILQQSWHCQCRTNLQIGLQDYSTNAFQVELNIPFCHAMESITVTMNDNGDPERHSPSNDRDLSTLHNGESQPSAPPNSGKKRKAVHFDQQILPTRSKSLSDAHGSSDDLVPGRRGLDLKADGLCKIIQIDSPANRRLGVACERSESYTFFSAKDRTPARQEQTVAEILSNGQPQSMLEAQRYKLAATLVSSYFQFHSTPWDTDCWTSSNILLPTVPDTNLTAVFMPFVSNIPVSLDDQSRTLSSGPSFLTLGITLLELCFGSLFRDHPKWQDPKFNALGDDPFVRLAIALDWSQGVTMKAGLVYAGAVDWLLRQAPMSADDGKWRKDFERHVWRPMQRHYGYVDPKAIHSVWQDANS